MKKMAYTETERSPGLQDPPVPKKSNLAITAIQPSRMFCIACTLLLLGCLGLMGSLSAQTTFNYTGSAQTYTVPVGVNTVTIDAQGAQGGGSNGGAGGLGARMVGDFSVTPGEVLTIVVGQQGLLQVGGNAQNSSGGGGGTFVYRTTGPSLLVAAGGGGGKCNWTSSAPLHPAAAGQITTSGGASSDGNPGGTAGAGGPAGLWSGIPCAGGGAGWLSAGGGPYGGASYSTWTGGPGYCGGGGGGCGGVGGFGGGGGGGNHYGGGGGGGGYSGGGGGTDPTHGGGGGSFSSGTNQSNTAGFRSGNGLVVITPLSLAPCATPTNVTASPSTLCTGATSNLSAISAGNTINWYTVPTGGTAIGSSASGANFPVTVSGTTTYYAEAVGVGGGSQTFNYTGAVQTFTVPSGVTSINIDARGAQGGGSNGGAGGLGAKMVGTHAVTPGQTLYVVVGQQGLLQVGGNAQNSSGGGGGTFVYANASTLLVAAGGGGGKCNYTGSGALHPAAAGQITTTGGASSDGNPGGTAGAGGPAGLWSGTPCAGGGTGWLSNGGGPYGGIGYSTWTGGPGFCGGGGGGCGGVGGFGGGGGGGNHYGGGGGGGGYSGGGGGTDPTHGGGGGSFSNGTSQANVAGFQSGNGQVTITWTGTACTASSRVPVTVTVGPLADPTNVTATPTTICPGDTIQLSATSGGSAIAWYTVPTGGTAIGSSASGANFPVTPTVATTYYAESINPGSGSQTFNYTGAVQTFTVPTGITSINIDARGAQGGGSFGGAGGLGAKMVGTHAVTPGQTLYVVIGQQGLLQVGGDAQNSSGGGGGTFVYANASTLLVAAGGGGGKCNYTGSSPLHPAAAGQITTTGGASSDGNPGGTAGAGGPAGLWSGIPCAGGGTGWLSNGGGPYGGIGYSTWTGGPGFCGGGGGGCGGVGGFGGGGGGGNHYGGGGGGGGYSGGGGGTDPTHGGGGGSFSNGTNQANVAGFQSGNGQVIITWTGVACVSNNRVPVTVSLDAIAPTAVCAPVTVQLDVNGNGSTTGNAVGGGSSDNCAVASLTLSQSSFTCSDAGNNNVTLTVSDANGNTSTCTAVVTVLSAAITSNVYADTTTCGYNVTCPGGNDGVAHAIPSGGCPGFTYLWSNSSTAAVATGLGAGTYAVTITDASGSTSVQSVTLTAPSPIQVTSTTSPACEGDPTAGVDISVTGGNDCQAYGFLWSNGATTEDLSNVVPGSYSVTITDGNGCTSVQSITIPALPAPNPLFTQSGYTLTSVLNWTSYQWLLNGTPISGATSNTYTATVSGSYALSVTDTNGCTGVSDTTNVTIIGVSGGMGQWADLTIYPNPTRNEFRLRTDNPIPYGITVTVRDMLGHAFLTENLPELGREAAFDIKVFAAGTYMVEVTSEQGQRKLFRLVVQ